MGKPYSNGHKQPAQRGDKLAYTLNEGAAVTGLSPATLRRLEKAGRLKFFKVMGRTLITAPSLHALMTADAA